MLRRPCRRDGVLGAPFACCGLFLAAGGLALLRLAVSHPRFACGVLRATLCLGGGGAFQGPSLVVCCVLCAPPPLPLPLSACVCYRARRVPPGAWRVASPPYAPADLHCASVWGRSIAKVCPPPKKEVYPEVMNSAFQGFVTRILFPVCDPHPNAPPTPCPLFHGTRSPTFPQAPSRPAAQRAGLWELVVRWFASMYCPEPSGCAQVNHRSCPNMPRDSAPPPPALRD